MADVSEDDEMTLNDAAKKVGVQPGSLRVAIHRGKLEGKKRGRDWFVTQKQLKAAGYKIKGS